MEPSYSCKKEKKKKRKKMASIRGAKLIRCAENSVHPDSFRGA